MNFVKFSNGVYVNLENVSSVKIINERLILNMNYCILKHGNTIPDYIYVNNFTESDVRLITDNTNLFVMANNNVFVNRNSIASVKVENDKVIINLAHPHSYNLTKKTPDGVKVTKSIIAEYVYSDMSLFDRV